LAAAPPPVVRTTAAAFLSEDNVERIFGTDRVVRDLMTSAHEVLPHLYLGNLSAANEYRCVCAAAACAVL
jgi:hypothetical protein